MNNCYVVSQGAFYDIPEGISKENTLFFPEASMTFEQLMTTGRPDGFNVITDSPFIVPLYKRNEVFVWDNESNSWENPDINTYGASYSVIMSTIFNRDNSIPQAVIDGGITNVMGFKIKK